MYMELLLPSSLDLLADCCFYLLCVGLGAAYIWWGFSTMLDVSIAVWTSAHAIDLVYKKKKRKRAEWHGTERSSSNNVDLKKKNDNYNYYCYDEQLF